MSKNSARTRIAGRMTKVTAVALALAIGSLSTGLLSASAVAAAAIKGDEEVLAQEAEKTGGSIQPPTGSESVGTFNGVAYVRRRGQFVGRTEGGRYAVPYEITLPSNPGEGNGTVVLEPPHFMGGALAVAGATPINWLPFIRALFLAGDEWVRNGTPPPASGTLSLPSDSK